MYTTTSKKSNKRDYGDGSIRYVEKKSLWEVRISNGRRGDGKQDRISRYAPTKADAKKLLKQMVKEKEAVLNRNAQSTTMNDVFTEFLDCKRLKLKENSHIRLSQTVENNILPEIGFIRLGDICFSDCKNLMDKFINEGYSLSTITKVYDALNACFKWAVNKRDIQYNPMTGIDKPAKGSEIIKAPKEMLPLTIEECEIFLKEG